MPSESLNNSDKNTYTKPINNDKEKITCKDGFCSIKDTNTISSINKDDINLFDPI